MRGIGYGSIFAPVKGQKTASEYSAGFVRVPSSAVANMAFGEIANYLIRKEVTEMLGEKLFEVTGKIQGQRILPADIEGPRMEITFVGSLQGHGRLASFKGMWTGTYIAVARSDGNFYGEGQAIVMSDKRGGFTARGFGLGRIAGAKFLYRGAITFRSTSPKLTWLNGVVGVFEYEQHMNTQEVTFTCYEWK